ncbi:MAG: hypothetical protein Kow0031_31990 [Anaerolineae bacterium]
MVSWPAWGGVLLLALLAGLFLYWQLIIAEGAYFGAKLVTLLYDWTAEKYNDIKEFDDGDEDFCLGRPLMARLYGRPDTTIVDVATGTGRVARVMLRQPNFEGRVFGVDRAARMLAVARRDTAQYGDRVALVQADAMALPFKSNSAPVVTCLEALEFTPSPRRSLAELVRVLQPADDATPARGWLLTTNRIGWEARLMPGKTWRRPQLEAVLQSLSLTRVEILPWQEIYDQVWAQKTGN